VFVQEQTPDSFAVQKTVIINRNDYLQGEWEFQSEIQQTLAFVDEAPGQLVGKDNGNHVFSTGDKTEATELADFFRRPVRIATYTWMESDPLGLSQTVYPWSAWANDARVQLKLNNYSFFRGDLHLKVVISASPFYYGMTKVTYQPLQNFTSSTITMDTGTRWFILNSQRPHLDVMPAENEAGTLVLPFIWHKNWINIQSSNDVGGLGQLYYSVYSQLQSANGTTGAGVNVTTYAWMENVELSGASAGYCMQSDEYEEPDGQISKPASTVAKVASYFESFPVIGPFATATRIGATAVSAIASMFGFTNVPVICSTDPYRPEAFPKMSYSEVSFPIEKLTLDAKNELSIDPRIVGLSSGIDELYIPHIAGRESYLTRATWSSTNITDDFLFYSRVNPLLYDNDNLTNSKVYLTPMGWLVNMFGSWRGDIIFRFKIICSQYHRGRLRISFDPSGYTAQNIGNQTATSNVVHTAIIDIGETQDVEFRVPYQQASQFLRVRSDLLLAHAGWAVNTTPPGTYLYDGSYDNGFLTVRVLNSLTAPTSSTSVDLQVYVRAAENIEYANPTDVDDTHTLSYFAPQCDEQYDFQSEEYSEDVPVEDVSLGMIKNPKDDQYKVHFGENIRSLRQLLRRYNFHSTCMFNTTSLATPSTTNMRKYMYRYPTIPGYSTGAIDLANGIVTTSSTFPYSYCQFTTLGWVLPAFVMYRGSVNWSFNALANGITIDDFRVVKDNLTITNPSIAINTTIDTDRYNVAYNMMVNTTAGSAGMAVTNRLTNAGLNVQMPNFSNSKFQTTNPAIANGGSTVDGSAYDLYKVNIIAQLPSGIASQSIGLNSFCAIGTDFAPSFFLNVPTVWIYSSVPTPA